MTRLALLIAACAIVLALTADARALPDPRNALIVEQIQVRERIEAKHERARKLRRRYFDWRQWRKVDVRERVHAWAVAGLGDGYSRYAPAGVPWCALYVSFCVFRGESRHPLPANPASTSSWRAAIRREVRGLREVVERRHIRRGDIVCFVWGHMGIFHRAVKAGFWSIEGNCTNRVRLRWHPWSAADTFGRVLFTKIPERFRGIAR